MRKSTILPAALFIGSFALIADAGVIRHDVDDSLYRALATQPQFAAASRLNIINQSGSILCSGTLITDEWVLTAAHCVDDTITSITYGSALGFRSVDQIIIHDDWDRSNILGGGDLALLHLSSPVNIQNPAQIYTGNNELGTVGTTVGFGRTGTGLTGSVGTASGLRAGQNVIDVLGSVRGWDDRILLTDFDSPLNPDESNYGDSTPLDLEYSLAPGDSGGGMFILTDSGWQLAGIGSFVNSTDGTPNGDYGDSNGYTRVSAYAGWINSVVPAPGVITMLGLGLGLGAKRRRVG